jgi:SagB-type dehydrogenase family enzyme
MSGRPAAAAEAIALPPLPAPGALQELLARRRSRRSFAAAPLSLAEVGALLWAAQGVRGPEGRRTAPSAGALYPLRLSLLAADVTGLERGLYRYEPHSHQLQPVERGDLRPAARAAALWQESVERAPALIAIAALPEVTAVRYGERALRYVHMEAGHAAQNVYLQAAALGLDAVALGAFRDAQLADVLRLGPGQCALYLMPVGRALP